MKRPDSCDATASNRPLRVLVLAPYPMGTAPNQRFRFEQYMGVLAQDGIRLDVSSFLDARMASVVHQPRRYAAKVAAVLGGFEHRARDLRAAGRFDLVLISREAAPLGYPWCERILRRLGTPYVLDFDDAIYLPSASPANRAIASLKFAAKTSIVARDAALVIAGNDHLAAWAGHYTDRVIVIPSTIDTAYHVPRTARAHRAGAVCIGWTGSVSTLPYLDALAPVLRDLQREHGVRLRVIGDKHYRIDGGVVEALPWRRASEIADLHEIDIGLMPMPDDEWTRGKCGLKALQYMALGIPAVMSPVGANLRIAEGGGAMLARTPAQWRSVLGRLIHDPALCVALGTRGREHVERNYSVNACARRWTQALRRAADGRI